MSPDALLQTGSAEQKRRCSVNKQLDECKKKRIKRRPPAQLSSAFEINGAENHLSCHYRKVETVLPAATTGVTVRSSARALTFV